MPVYAVNFYIHFMQQFNEQVNINDIRDIIDHYFIGSKQYCTDYLQGFIFCTLCCYFPAKFFSTPYFKYAHTASCILIKRIPRSFAAG